MSNQSYKNYLDGIKQENLNKITANQNLKSGIDTSITFLDDQKIALQEQKISIQKNITHLESENNIIDEIILLL